MSEEVVGDKIRKVRKPGPIIETSRGISDFISNEMSSCGMVLNRRGVTRSDL